MRGKPLRPPGAACGTVTRFCGCLKSSGVPAGLNVCTSGSAASCEECLLIHPSCAWCAQEVFGRNHTLVSRCDLVQNLQKKNCEKRFIEFSTSHVQVLKNIPLSSKRSGFVWDRVVQVSPQKISLSLRPGKEQPSWAFEQTLSGWASSWVLCPCLSRTPGTVQSAGPTGGGLPRGSVLLDGPVSVHERRLGHHPEPGHKAGS
uniref:PSI domain-containing protein n=1 Tax=Oryzias sinensis TaxID=183150 RepID=A0A8C7WXR3_9TELE